MAPLIIGLRTLSQRVGSIALVVQAEGGVASDLGVYASRISSPSVHFELDGLLTYHHVFWPIAHYLPSFFRPVLDIS